MDEARGSFDTEAELRHVGAPVTVADVIKHKLPFHAKCGGKGWTGKKEAPDLCACAIKRFLARNAGKVVQVRKGEYAWLREAA